jgi:hypothetical protein
MRDDFLTFHHPNLRGIDSNSLLRMYDAARVASARAPSQQERARADRAIQRIAKGLGRRNVSPEGGTRRAP